MSREGALTDEVLIQTVSARPSGNLCTNRVTEGSHSRMGATVRPDGIALVKGLNIRQQVRPSVRK